LRCAAIYSLSFKRENVALEARRDAAQLEQLGHVLALQDKAYLDELNRIGERRKLYDKANWEKEKRSVIYGANLSRIMEDLGFRRGEDIKDRNFQEQMTRIDLDTALSMAVQAAKDANTTAIASSIISTGSKAFDTAYSKGMFDSTSSTTSIAPPTGTAGYTDMTGGGMFDVTGAGQFSPLK